MMCSHKCMKLLNRSVDNWEEENLTKLREQQLNMIKCLECVHQCW